MFYRNSNLTLNEVTDVTFTKTGGACTVNTFKVRKRGNEVMFRITVQSTATVASASNLLEGTINKYKPIDVYTSGSFSGGTSIGAVVYADGRVIIRVHGGVSLSSGLVVNIGFNYLTAE